MVHKTQSGLKFLIDKEDFERVSALNWVHNGNYIVNRKRYGPRKDGKVRITFLHRFLLGLQPGDGKIVDHINRNKLDNRKSNLRLCSQRLNLLNRGLQRNNKSGRTGVYYNKDCKRWEASAYKYNRRIVLGHSKDFSEAVQIREAYERTPEYA